MKALIDAGKALHNAVDAAMDSIEAQHQLEVMALQAKSAEQLDLLLQVMQTAGGLLDTKLHDRIAEALRASGICGDEEPFEAGIADHDMPEIDGRQEHDADWTEWSTGRCPAELDSRVDVKMRDGTVLENVPACWVIWQSSVMADRPIDVIAYRRHQPERIGGGGRPEPDTSPKTVLGGWGVPTDTHPGDDNLITLDECEQLGIYAKAAGFEDVVMHTVGGAGMPVHLRKLKLDGYEYNYPTRKLLRGLKELAEELERASTITNQTQYAQTVGRIKRQPAPKPPLGGLTGDDFEKLHQSVNASKLPAETIATAMSALNDIANSSSDSTTAGLQQRALKGLDDCGSLHRDMQGVQDAIDRRKKATTRMVQALRMAHEALARTTLGQGCDAAYFAVAEALELAEAEGLS